MITPRRQRLDGDLPALETGAQFLLKVPGVLWLDLVLDRDVREPGRLIRGSQQFAKSFNKFVPYAFKFRALHAERGAAAKVHDSRHFGPRRASGGAGGKASAKFRLEAWREMVEQGEMRRHAVMLRRIVSTAQLLEPAIVASAEQRGDDDGAAAQIST